MAAQLGCREMLGCPTYLEWLIEKVNDEPLDRGDILHTSYAKSIIDDGSKGAAQMEAIGLLLSYLYRVDFIADVRIEEDTIRATDAMELRRRYAEEVGSESGKSERDIDRIWKSVHGKCSMLEFLLQLCIRMDEQVNEDEPEAMVGLFFGILLENLGLRECDSEDVWQRILDRFLAREYCADGSGGGLFPLSGWVDGVSKDQREVSIWYQLAAWMSEHLDEEEHFRVEDFSLRSGERKGAG